MQYMYIVSKIYILPVDNCNLLFSFHGEQSKSRLPNTYFKYSRVNSFHRKQCKQCLMYVGKKSNYTNINSQCSKLLIVICMLWKEV